MAFLKVIVENDGHWFVKYEHQLPIQLTTRNVNSKMITTWQISLLSMDIYTSSLVQWDYLAYGKGKLNCCPLEMEWKLEVALVEGSGLM